MQAIHRKARELVEERGIRAVLDADSFQRNAIDTVLAGQSLVIHGPPGTGKSQTIANLIAALVARGRKVLFVAEKRAAIDAVLSRLKGVAWATWCWISTRAPGTGSGSPATSAPPSTWPGRPPLRTSAGCTAAWSTASSACPGTSARCTRCTSRGV